MKEKKTIKIIRSRLKKITALAGELGHGFDTDVVHDFRTSVKSLRSFLRFIRLHTGNAKLKFSKGFKRLYHIAGAVRDAQLELETINKRKLLFPAYASKLHRLLSSQQAEWKKKFSHHELSNVKKKLTGHRIGALRPAALEKFCLGKINGIDTLLDTRLSDNQIHEIRKMIKDILYNKKIAGKDWPAAGTLLLYFPENRLNRIAGLIGDYNDARIFTEQLTSFSSKTMSAEEVAAIQNYCAGKKQERALQRKRIISLVSSLRGKVKP